MGSFFSWRHWPARGIALVTLFLLVGLVQPARAELEIIVPQAAITPIVDGNIDSSTEYLGAATIQIPYPGTAFASDVSARLVYTPDDLYIGVVFPTVQAGTSINTSSLTFLFDPDYSRDALAQASDFQIEVPFDGNPPRWLVGDGLGSYINPASPPSFGPGGQWDVKTDYCGSEFTFPCVEVRVARELLGTFGEIDGFAIVHRNLTIGSLTGDYPAPPDAGYNSPSTWASLLYGGLSAELPRAKFAGTVKDVSLGGETGLSEQQVFLRRGDTLSPLYNTTTDGSGGFSFDVPVPADIPLSVQIADCAYCSYELPSFGGIGIGATISTTLSVTFPGCPAGTTLCTYQDTGFRVWRPNSVGQVDITSYTPEVVTGTVVLRDGTPPVTTTSRTSTMRIHGVNLHPFGRFFLHPNTSECRVIPPGVGCPAIEAIVTDRSPYGDWVDVQVPTVNLGSYFWVFRDDWIRTANSGIGINKWRYGPIFTVKAPPFPEVYGFGFQNEGDSTGIDEFLSVYQYSAYICPGVWTDGVCLAVPIPIPIPPVPEPRYWVIGFPVFKTWMDAGGENNGTCLGMAATSQLMYLNLRSPSKFDPAVHFANGFDRIIRPTGWEYDSFPKAPIPRPVNLWAEIRQNHGVQASMQFMMHVLDGWTLGAVHVLNLVRTNPHNWIICLRQGGSGHCVTPFDVQDVSPTQTDILIYDNNYVDQVRKIEINLSSGGFTFEQAAGKIWSENISAIPVDVWQGERTFLDDLEGVRAAFVFGSASALYSDSQGGRWGVDPESGAWVEDMEGAMTLPLMVQATGEAVPAMLALPSSKTPTATISSHGGGYIYLNSGEGLALQLINLKSTSGDQDQVRLGSLNGHVNSLSFKPERQADSITPRVSMKLGQDSSAVFTWQGLSVPAGAEVGFTGLPDLKGAAISNNSAEAMSYSLTVQLADGKSGLATNVTFGSIDIPAGYNQRLTIADWPTASSLLVENDADGDGVYESSDTIAGGHCPPQDLDGDGFAETCMNWLPPRLYLPLIGR